MKKYNLIILSIVVLFVAVVVWLIVYIRTLAIQGPHDGLTNIATGMHLNVWDWLAVSIAFFSLGVSGYNTWAQYKTMKNTSTLDTKMVWTVMLSYYHNIIRNTIMLYALREVLERDGYRRHPSEDILEKMNIDFLKLEQIPIQCMKGKNYYYIKGMIELTRIFNISLVAAQRHLMSNSVERLIKAHDINNLVSQNWMLAYNLYSTLTRIYPTFSGRGETTSQILSKTAGEIQEYIMNITREYDRGMSDGDSVVYEKIESESRRFVSSVFGHDSTGAGIFINRLKDVIASRCGVRPDGLPYIILI